MTGPFCQWQVDLETLRRLVAERAPLAQLEGTTPSASDQPSIGSD